jgi:hypothetical protein
MHFGGSQSRGPTALHMPAQGNALGLLEEKTKP